MDAGQIQRGKFLRESGLFAEAAQLYYKILKQNPSDKLAKLGYAQCLAKQGLKEKIKPLLFRAEKVLFELIKDDYSYSQAHDELILLSHYLNHMGSLSKYYHEKLMQYPDRDIYQKSLKKVSAMALLSIPENAPGKKKKRSFIVNLLIYQYIILMCVGLLLSLTVAKYRQLFVPSLIMIGLFIAAGFSGYFKDSKKSQW